MILIGELAKRTLCSVRVIRHYGKCGLLLSRRSGNGYRQFDEAAVALAQALQSALSDYKTTQGL